MNENYPGIDSLLAKKFAGEASATEEASISSWVNEKPQHAAYFKEAQWLWNQMALATDNPGQVPETEPALTRVKQQIRKRQKIRTYTWATLILTLLLLAVFTYAYFKRTAVATIIAQGEQVQKTLPDGSGITLSQNSEITVKQGFNGKERRLSLRGSAQFNVVHDGKKPFVVEVDGLSVTVVGTVFSIEASAPTDSIRIVVSEGRVWLQAKDQELFVSAGESAVFNRKSDRLNPVSLTGAVHNSDRQFVFDATPLPVVISQINAAYKVNILLLNPKLSACTLTARFENQPFERILEILTETFSLKVRSSSNTFEFLDGQCTD